MKLQNEIARDLMDIKAVQIRPNHYITWTSGIKSPIYCDNRLTMSYPAIRKKITQAFMGKLTELNIKPDVVAGCATAGLPHAAWLANELDLPMIYVRSKPKGHGKGNQIEGKIEKGQSVVVIEDLISTGGSSLETATVLRNQGVNVLGVLAIFTYGLAVSEKNFKKDNILFDTITSFDNLLDVLETDKEITDKEKKQLLDWREHL